MINLGSGGLEHDCLTVAGGPGVTITGGAAALNYNTGFSGTGGDDFVNLTGGRATPSSAASALTTARLTTRSSPAMAATSVWGGQGDRIGVGFGASGTDLFTHASTINGASVGFGSADSVVAASYGNTAGAVAVNGAVAGRSAAQVTVTGFSEAKRRHADRLHLLPERVGGDEHGDRHDIEPGQPFPGLPSTQLTLPDGTVMTLLGVPKADFNTSFFR